MTHLVLAGRGKLEWRESAPVELQAAGEAIVRPLVVGRCDLDVAFVNGLMPMPIGSPIGHEIIAEVLEVGSDAKLLPGDRVFVSAQISCGRCAPCLRGATGRCQNVPFGASYGMGREGDYGGGLSDRLRVPYANAMLTPVPISVDPIGLIGLADMATDAWRGTGLHIARIPDARVLVIGGMPAVIGLFAALMAKACGAGVVHYVDDQPARREIVAREGIHCLQLGEVQPAFYDIVFLSHPSKATLEAAFAAAAPAGHITSAAPCLDGSPKLDTASLYHRGVTWSIGRPDCRGLHDGTMHAWGCCGFDPGIVPATKVSWEDASDAWASDALYVVASRE